MGKIITHYSAPCSLGDSTHFCVFFEKNHFKLVLK